MESDLFQQRPDPNDKNTCVSWSSQLTVLASKNMAWVFEVQTMLAAMQGQKFLSNKRFVKLAERQGQNNSKVFK